MQIRFEGLESLRRRMVEAQKRLEKAGDQFAEEAATEILAVAIDKASGPNYMSKYKAEQRREARRKRKVRKLSRTLPFLKYNTNGSLQYPVPVITGTFRRAHKFRKVGPARYEVYGDLNTANYFTWVHDGTSKMEGRATIDDAFTEVIHSGKLAQIGKRIVRDALRGEG